MTGDETLFSIVDAPVGAGASPTLPGDDLPGSPALFGRSLAELAELAAQLGQPAYRARQLEQALYREWVSDLASVSTLPRTLRDALQTHGYVVGLPEIVETFRSIDGTERYLIAGLDGQTVETVWMPGGDGGEHGELEIDDDSAEPVVSTLSAKRGVLTHSAELGVSTNAQISATSNNDVILSEAKDLRLPPALTVNDAQITATPSDSALASKEGDAVILSEAKELLLPSTSAPRERPPQRRATICVSSQIGCAVNCRFCLTARLGIVRNLTAGEIAGQVVAVLKRQGVHLGRDRINLVFMGMGEPFLNYDAFIAALHLLTDSVGLAASRMTVSTSGIVPGILRFAQEPVRCKLAISLNASNDAVREQVMPITRKWNTDAILAAVRTIPLGPRERITFEYVLLGSVNDQPTHADELIRLVRTAGFACYVNLIVWNPGPGIPYAQPEPEAVAAFQHRLISQGVTAYIRRPRGRDIYAACGQLKNTTS